MHLEVLYRPLQIPRHAEASRKPDTPRDVYSSYSCAAVKGPFSRSVQVTIRNWIVQSCCTVSAALHASIKYSPASNKEEGPLRAYCWSNFLSWRALKIAVCGSGVLCALSLHGAKLLLVQGVSACYVLAALSSGQQQQYRCNAVLCLQVCMTWCSCAFPPSSGLAQTCTREATAH